MAQQRMDGAVLCSKDAETRPTFSNHAARKALLLVALGGCALGGYGAWGLMAGYVWGFGVLLMASAMAGATAVVTLGMAVDSGASKPLHVHPVGAALALALMLCSALGWGAAERKTSEITHKFFVGDGPRLLWAEMAQSSARCSIGESDTDEVRAAKATDCLMKAKGAALEHEVAISLAQQALKAKASRTPEQLSAIREVVARNGSSCAQEAEWARFIATTQFSTTGALGVWERNYQTTNGDMDTYRALMRKADAPVAKQLDLITGYRID